MSSFLMSTCNITFTIIGYTGNSFHSKHASFIYLTALPIILTIIGFINNDPVLRTHQQQFYIFFTESLVISI